MLIRKTLTTLVVAAMAAAISPVTFAADKAAEAPASSRSTVKGGSDYEKTMQQTGMSAMSGMSGDHSMTAEKKPAKAGKAKKKKKAAKAKTNP